MGIKVITPPSVEPITLTEAKVSLSIDDDIDNADITRGIAAARKKAEKYMGRSLITQTLELALDHFPDDIELPRSPVQSISSIKYLDSDGVEQTFSNTKYALDNYSHRHWALLAAGESWPSTYDAANAVKVRYVAGYGNAGSDVDEDIIEAMLKLIGHWVRFQAQAESGIGPTRIPMQFHELLDDYRIIKF